MNIRLHICFLSAVTAAAVPSCCSISLNSLLSDEKHSQKSFCSSFSWLLDSWHTKWARLRHCYSEYSGSIHWRWQNERNSVWQALWAVSWAWQRSSLQRNFPPLVVSRKVSDEHILSSSNSNFLQKLWKPAGSPPSLGYFPRQQLTQFAVGTLQTHFFSLPFPKGWPQLGCWHLEAVCRFSLTAAIMQVSPKAEAYQS